jgi:predicted esterase
MFVRRFSSKMSSINNSAKKMSALKTLRCEVIEPAKKHTSTIVWCHGLGDSSAGFSDLFRYYICPKLQNTRVVLPNAPSRPITINMGMKMPGWYDIKSLSKGDGNEDREGILEVLL